MTTVATQPRERGQRRLGELYDRSFLDRLRVLVDKEQAAERQRLRLAEERAVWEGEADDVCQPFGVDWRDYGAPVVDLLIWVEPAGEHWRWIGRTNNKGLAVVRRRIVGGPMNTEWSAQRMLHELLVDDHEGPKAMHPLCDAPFVCVRPAHRCRRWPFVCVRPAHRCRRCAAGAGDD